MNSAHLNRRRSKTRLAFLATAAAVLLSTFSTMGLTSSAGAADLVPKPVFSQQHGYFDSPFQLTLSPAVTAPAGTTIRYTVNGATPTATSGTVYTTPVTIDKTTPVRAVAISGSVPSEIVAKTYIFLDDVRTQSNTQPGYPTVFAAPDPGEESPGPYPADYEVDPEVVNHYSTSQVDDALKSVPTMAITTDIKNLFDPASGVYYNPNEKGSLWERPVSVEYIDPTGATPGFSTNAGIRIHGQASRRPWNTPKKSMRLYFKASYGNGKLEFPLFQGNGEAFQPVEVFDRLILRNGGNRSYPYFDRDQRREADYANDGWARDAFLDMGHLSPHGTYVQLYINGLYWGLYDTTERIDEKFYASYLGGNPDTDFDVISADEDQGNAPVAEVGDLTTYNSVLDALGTSGTVSNATYQSLLPKLDMVSLADYLILTHYIGKTDWPNHNWDVYRKRTGPDQRLKFSSWDNDSGLNKVSENTTLRNLNPELIRTPAQMYWRLITNPEFKQLVNERIQLQVLSDNAPLSPAKCAERYSALTDEIDQAIIGESARWGDYSRDVYQNQEPKAGPAYLYTRDFTDAEADPGNLVVDGDQKNWTEVRAEKLATYCPQRAGVFINQYVVNGWYLDAPTVAPNGGDVSAGTDVTISNPNTVGTGEIFYTTDGTDPRADEGVASPGALNGGDSKVVTIDASTTIKARIKNGTTWSSLITNTYTVDGLPPVVLATAPGVPTAVAGDQSATLTWTAPSSFGSGTFSKYEVVAEEDVSKVCSSTDANTRTCTVTGLTNGTAYRFKVRAVTSDGNGPYSALSTAVTPNQVIAGAFTPVDPARLLDTRTGVGLPGGTKAKVAANGVATFQVAGNGGVPADAGAVVLNVTATAPAKAGFATAYPAGSPRPGASNLNFVAGQTIANHVTVELGTGGDAGKVSLYNGSGGTVDMFADVAGYYAAGDGVENGTFTAVAPNRLLDTRTGAKPGPNSTTSFQVTNTPGIPSDGVGAGVFNVTVANPTKGGYITAFPFNLTKPNASNLNFLAGQAIPNAATVKLGTGGKVSLFNGSAGTVNLLADVAGWFKDGAASVPGAFTPVDPARLLDTRPGAQVPAKGRVTLTVAGQGTVPSSGAGAAVLNVTVANTGAAGFITAYPTGATQPNASNINFVAGQAIPNLVTVKLGTDGKVTFYNGSTKPVDLLADIAGWYLD